MRIGAGDFFHLTYCTNIHPGEAWQDVFANLDRHVPELKAALAPQQPFGIGLRLADRAARELLDGDRLDRFRAWLAERDLYVFTLNGFPFGGFHRQVVKDQVYAPDWRTDDRAAYTLRLACILAALVPEGLDGGISTAPISYKPWLKTEDDRRSALHNASLRLAAVTAELAGIAESTGRRLHVDIEPEPDCLLENLAETVDFFRDWLVPVGVPVLAERLGIARDAAEGLLLDHVRVCYDTCHFAVEYEDPAAVVARLADAGIRIGKLQISSALKVPLPEEAGERRRIAERLRPFAESTYLHQVVERRAGRELRHHADLSDALHAIADPAAREWRIHFHVPIFLRAFPSFSSTQDDIRGALDVLGRDRFTRHLEIETYTWDVLPADLKVDVLTSIRREYDWVLDVFRDSEGRAAATSLGARSAQRAGSMRA